MKVSIKTGEKTLGIQTGEGLGVIGVVLIILYYWFLPSFFLRTLELLVLSAPLWLPFYVGMVFWKLWVRYRRAHFVQNWQEAVIEIRIPREIRKSPLAMEAVFSGLNLTLGETTFIDRNFLGKARTWFSFELVSIDGNIHFYIWTHEFFKELIKTQIYAQYPEVEIYDVEDYTKFVPFDLKKYRIYGCDFRLTNKDPFPLKSYIDYGLDNPAAKEEEKTNPFASLLEFLASLPKGHQMWVQIIIQAHRGSKRWPWQKYHSVREQTEEILEEMFKNAAARTKRVTGGLEDDQSGMRTMALTEAEREMMKVLERSMSKLNFDCGIRTTYIAETEKFENIILVGMLGIWKQFSSTSPHYNGLRYTRFLAGFDYPWQDYKDILRNRARRRLYEAYRLRSWFHGPYKTQPFMLNTEELATIYHFPGEAVKTPTVPRIPSRRGEPPANLPV